MSQITIKRKSRVSGISSCSATSSHLKMFSILVVFICSLLHCVLLATGENDARFVYNKSNADAAASSSSSASAEEHTDTNVKLLEENETDPVSMKR